MGMEIPLLSMAREWVSGKKFEKLTEQSDAPGRKVGGSQFDPASCMV